MADGAFLVCVWEGGTEGLFNLAEWQYYFKWPLGHHLNVFILFQIAWISWDSVMNCFQYNSHIRTVDKAGNM